MKNLKIKILFFSLSLVWTLSAVPAHALPVGTLLFRTSGGGLSYGYNTNILVIIENGFPKNFYSGHTGIYVGQEDGVDYVVEMQPQGAIKIPANQFVNTALGEKLISAKIPKNSTAAQRARAAALAKNLARAGVDYDFDFKYQKGPGSAAWTCVGLAEKVYESANTNNPADLTTLVYNTQDYAVDITPDGFDNVSVYNQGGDCFSETKEFSKIARKTELTLPLPEKIGYDFGLEKGADRFIFFPQTQEKQDSLISVPVDIDLDSEFRADPVRGRIPVIKVALKWSLINNPVSTVKQIGYQATSIAQKIKDFISPTDDNLVYLEEKEVAPLPPKKVSSDKEATSPTVVKTDPKTSTPAPTPTKVVPASVPAVNPPAKTTPSQTSKTEVKTEPIKVLSPTPKKETPLPSAASDRPATTVLPSATPAQPKTDYVPIKVATPKESVTNQLKKLASDEAENENNKNTVPTNTNTEEELVSVPQALISKVYSNGTDDWLEIVNASDQDLDLVAYDYRLVKLKGGSPVLIMDFGNENHGTYPGGTVIAPHSSYLVVRSSAAENVKALADAISTRDNFSWTEDGYTLYLGTGAISSDEDVDIVDRLGYGEALYYSGAPAPALVPGYALERKATASSTIESLSSGGLEELWARLYDSRDNSRDFLLIPYDYELIKANEEKNNPPAEEEVTEEETETEVLPPELIDTAEGLFVNPASLESKALTQLWHFDECFGAEHSNALAAVSDYPQELVAADLWGIGKWGCALKLDLENRGLKSDLPPDFDSNNFTIAFYYRKDIHGNFFIDWRLNNRQPETQQFSLNLNEYRSEIHGFPGPNGYFYDLTWPADDNWHQVALVVNQAAGYWGLYLDGEEKYLYENSWIIPEFTDWEIELRPNTPAVLIDELSLWLRPLSEAELKKIFDYNLPFYPYTWPDPQRAPELEHYWRFDENNEEIARDEIGGDDLAVKVSDWNMEGFIDSSLKAVGDFSWDLTEMPLKDSSFAFWWRNTSHPNEGRFNFKLRGNDKDIFTLMPTIYNPSFSFNGSGGFLGEYGKDYFPMDKNWHHLAITYDSYRYRWRFFFDGELWKEVPAMKLRPGTVLDQLVIDTENYPSDIDELKIWSGVLNKEAILAEYESYREYLP